MFFRLVFTGLIGFLAKHAAGQAYYGSQELSTSFGMSVEITVNDDNDDTVSITMVGPSNRWFGVGFGGTSMENTYAIIAYGTGDGTDVMERKLGDGSTEAERAGTLLTATVTVVSDTTSNGVRTVELTRSREGDNSDYYTYPDSPGDISLIYARGSSDGATDVAAHGAGNYGSSSIGMATFMPFLKGMQTLNSDWGMSVEANVKSRDSDTVYITLVGPSNRWFGVGFGGSEMNNTYAIIAYGTGDNVAVMERKLGSGSTENERAGTELTQSVAIMSDVTSDGTRTVMLNRSRVMTDDDYYTFPGAEYDIPVIYARGAQDDATDVAAHGASNAGTGTLMMEELEERFSGSVDVDGAALNVSIVVEYGVLTLTLCGENTGYWMGLGICEEFMQCGMDGTYAFTFNESSVVERVLGDHQAGEVVNTSNSRSSMIDDREQCVEVNRDCTDFDSDLYCGADLVEEGTLVTTYFIAALGNTEEFAVHASKYQQSIELCAYVDGTDNSTCQRATSVTQETTTEEPDNPEVRYSGSVNINEANLNVSIDIDGDELTLTLCGETTGFWMGVGFCDGTEQCGMDGTYAITIDGSDSSPVQRILGNGQSGTEIDVDTGVEYEANSGERCVSVMRECDVDEDADLYCGSDLAGMGTRVTKYVIAALGNTEEFAYHASKYQQSIDLCAFEDGSENEDCQMATAVTDPQSTEGPSEDGSTSVGLLVGFLVTLFSLLWN